MRTHDPNARIAGLAQSWFAPWEFAPKLGSGQK